MNCYRIGGADSTERPAMGVIGGFVRTLDCMPAWEWGERDEGQ